MLPQLLAAVCLAFPSPSRAAHPRDAVLLSEVQSLTLRGHGAMTSHRRVSAIPQLKCISSKDMCSLFEIDFMRCTNQGSSYGSEDIEWSCTASLPEELKLGSTDVICEGYSSPNDPFVLKGSCGVEYRLLLTAKGEARYPDVRPYNGFFSRGSEGTDWSAWLFAVVFAAVLGWILYSACLGSQGQRRQPRPWAERRGGGGGGGGGGWNPGWGPGDDPPPPYPGSKPHSTQSQGWTPGFWTGLLGGAAAGYMAGGRRQRDQDTGPFSSNWGAGPSSSPRYYSPPSSASGGSSARHESTGFGSTRRR